MSQVNKTAAWFLLGQWVLIACYALSMAYRDVHARPLWVMIVGIIVAVVGLIVIGAAGAAHAIVNKSGRVRISPTPDSSRKLVDRGIYSKVRHPMYLGAILFLAGIALSFGGYLTGLVTLAAIAFVYIKALYEEKLLKEIYPEYPAYMERTARILPFL